MLDAHHAVVGGPHLREGNSLPVPGRAQRASGPDRFHFALQQLRIGVVIARNSQFGQREGEGTIAHRHASGQSGSHRWPPAGQQCFQASTADAVRLRQTGEVFGKHFVRQGPHRTGKCWVADAGRERCHDRDLPGLGGDWVAGCGLRCVVDDGCVECLTRDRVVSAEDGRDRRDSDEMTQTADRPTRSLV